MNLLVGDGNMNLLVGTRRWEHEANKSKHEPDKIIADDEIFKHTSIIDAVSCIQHPSKESFKYLFVALRFMMIAQS